MRTPALLAALAAILILPPLALAEEEEGPYTPEEQKILSRALRFERELVTLVEKVRPRSVSIENWQGRVPSPRGAGSGVIVSRQGHILTNQHVVKGAAQVWVVLHDHRRFKAEVVGRDERGDVALLRIDANRIRHASPSRADAGRLSAGEWIIATGNPFFLATDGEPVVTLGIVSGLGRVLGGEFFYGNAIQHDASINPGNSGGPLWDTNGNLLGLNGKIAGSGAGGQQKSSSGVGFTIPIDQIRNFLDEMLLGKKSLHGDQILGLTVKSAKDDDGQAVGAEITKIKKGSPAVLPRNRGVKVGDVIYKITVRGRPNHVRTGTDYVTLTSTLDEGTRISLHVKRGYKRLTIPNIVLDPPAPKKRGGRGK